MMRTLWRHFDDIDFDLNFLECGGELYDKQHIYSYTAYQNYVIHYIVEGRGYYIVNDNRYLLEPNDGFIIKRNDKVTYYPEKDSRWEYYWVGLSGSFLKNILQDLTKDKKRILNYNNNSLAAKTILEICHYAQTENDPVEEYVFFKYKSYQLIYELYEEFLGDKRQVDSSSYNDIVESAKRIINDRYMKELKVSQIATELGISRSHLYRVFKETTGSTVQQYIIDTRMGIATSELRIQDVSIREVALNVGYHDPLLFSKTFKKYSGLSPSEYQKVKLREEVLKGK